VTTRRLLSTCLLLPLAIGALAAPAAAQSGPASPAVQDSLDARVRAFLDANRRDWRDMNVPMADGQRLHDLVVENGFTRALEIGTSTGHSAIWIAWALSGRVAA
jgi:predicted O-methyltransferase YrrM